jgi:hypothetical protein
MIHFLTVGNEMREYLDSQGRDLADRIRVLSYAELPGQTHFERGTYIVSASDQLTGTGRRMLDDLCATLSGTPDVRILNHPGRTLTRYPLLSALHGLGRNAFRAVPARGDLRAIRFPVFVRSEWQHTGAWSPLLHSPRAVEGAIGELVLRGHRADELLVVEFCETADADGVYRKFAAFNVGGEIIPRSLASGRRWMLKQASSDFTLDMVLEERDYVLGNPHQEALREIFAFAGIEYGRMDYALSGGEIQVWEINLNPTIGRGRRPKSGRVPTELEPIREQSKQAFYRRFAEALAALDPGPAQAPPVTVRFDAGVTARGARILRRRAPRFGAFRALYRPFRPLLEPVARMLFPVVGRLLRRPDSLAP